MTPDQHLILKRIRRIASNIRIDTQHGDNTTYQSAGEILALLDLMEKSK
jgi:hypothetical protein